MKTSKSAVTRVRKYFPQVNKVVDAREGVVVRVKKQDSKLGRKKDPSGCALARACVRECKADGAIINVGYSYIVKGNLATRYKTSATVGREVVSFDRHQDFACGSDYLLSKVSPCNRLGRHKTEKGRKSGPKLTKAQKPTLHRTVRIRTARS